MQEKLKNQKLLEKSGWQTESSWYSNMVEKDNSYQRTLILPNVLRLLQIKKNDKILDIACGQGFFSKEMTKNGAVVSGIDSSSELIGVAENEAKNGDFRKNLTYKVALSNIIPFPDQSFDKSVIILAIDNIKKYGETLKEAGRTLKKDGGLLVVFNHPFFRIIGRSRWVNDAEKSTTSRQIDSYMSESQKILTIHPRDRKGEVNVYHRPLQAYSKALQKSGFVIEKIEEWISDKESLGKNAEEENRVRKEFPLFIAILAKRTS